MDLSIIIKNQLVMDNNLLEYEPRLNYEEKKVQKQPSAVNSVLSQK
jgi:hypothetical protein